MDLGQHPKSCSNSSFAEFRGAVLTISPRRLADGPGQYSAAARSTGCFSPFAGKQNLFGRFEPGAHHPAADIDLWPGLVRLVVPVRHYPGSLQSKTRKACRGPGGEMASRQIWAVDHHPG